MLIPIKHDNLNGLVGVSPGFPEAARKLIDTFRERIQENPDFIPRNPGADFPFLSFLAAFDLPFERDSAVLTWVHVSKDQLRDTVSFTTLHLPLGHSNPLTIAKGVLTGSLKKEILEAIRNRRYEIDVPAPLLGPPPRTVSPRLDGEPDPLALPLLSEAALLKRSEEVFSPFITFRPADGAGRSARVAEAVAPVRLDTSPSSPPEPAVLRPAGPAPSSSPPHRTENRRALPGMGLAALSLLLLSVGFGLGFAMRRLPEKEGPTAATPPLGSKSAEAGFVVHRSPIEQPRLTPAGPSSWMYGGELTENGLPAEDAASPTKKDYDPPLSAGGKKVHELLESFYVRPWPDRELTREKVFPPAYFIILEELNEGGTLSQKPGRKPRWWKVQFLQEPTPPEGTGTGTMEESFESNARNWPTLSNQEVSAWVSDGEYAVAVDSQSFQALTAPLQLPAAKEGVEITLESTWQAGEETGEYGLALFNPDVDPAKHFIFYVTRKLEAGILDGAKAAQPEQLSKTSYKPDGDGTVQTLVLGPAGVKYLIGKAVVYENQELDLTSLSHLGLVVRGREAVTFRKLSIKPAQHQ